MGSLWEDVGKTMEGDDAVEVGEVDCGTNKPLCSKVKIGSYPTFKLFYNGEEVARYRGMVLPLIFVRRLCFLFIVLANIELSQITG